jgi:hypothetical protein
MLCQPGYLGPVADAAYCSHSNYAVVVVASQYAVLDSQRGAFRQGLKLLGAAIVCGPHNIPAEIRSRCVLVTDKIQKTLRDSVLTEATDDLLGMIYVTLMLATAAAFGMPALCFAQDDFFLLAAITLHQRYNTAPATPDYLDDPESVVLQADGPDVHRKILLWSPGSTTTAIGRPRTPWLAGCADDALNSIGVTQSSFVA